MNLRINVGVGSGTVEGLRVQGLGSSIDFFWELTRNHMMSVAVRVVVASGILDS